MKNQEAAHRYAKALFELATEGGNVESVLNEVRELSHSFEKDADVRTFFTAPVIKSEDQKKVFQKLTEKKSLSQEVRGLVSILIEKKRMLLFQLIALAFQAEVDASQNVTRGHVKSATTLFPEERQKLEATISRYTGKKAVLEYSEDKS